MKEFWNKLLTKLKEIWTSFRAWKYSNIALWSAAGVAVAAVAVVIVLCAVGPKGNDNPTLPTGGSSMDGTNPTGGDNTNNGGSNNGGSTDNNGGSSSGNNGGSSSGNNGGSSSGNNGGSSSGNNGGSSSGNNGGSSSGNNGGSSSGNNGGSSSGNNGSSSTPSGPAKPPVVENDNTNSGAALAPEATADQMKNVVAVKTSTAGGTITAHPGGRVTYTISITNNNSQAISVNVTDTLPEGTSLVRGGTANGKTISWKVNRIEPGKTHNIIYTVKPEYTIKQVRDSQTDIIIKNTAAKVQDKAVAAPSKDIYVLETFNAEDRRKMEMAIDAMVAANLTAKNSYKMPMNRIPLLNMMYYVGFSAAPGFGTNVADPSEILTTIFDKAGESGGSSGSAGTEDVVETASNLLNKVVPTLYGGTKVPSSKDSLFRGARATSVTVADLIPGDAVFVENGGKAKLYVYDGTYLVELAETKVTTNIAPASVLSTLPSSDRYAILRASIGYNITFALNEDEYFNKADKEGYTTLEKQLIATAEAYLLRGDRNQYTDDSTGTSTNRAVSTTKQPEDCTVDQYGYTNCAYFTYDVHWATYGVAAQATLSSSGRKQIQSTTTYLADAAKYKWNAETKTGGNKSTIFYCEPKVKSGDEWVSNMTEAEQTAAKQYIIDNLRPGDIICIRRTSGSGHAMLYAGNGTIIHSSGSNYSRTNKTDTHEATVRFRMVADLFDPTIYNTSSYVFNLASFSIVRLQNLTTNAAATQNTLNRVNNMTGIVAEKITSTSMGKTVNPGDTITYTFHVFNTNKDAKTVEIKDVLSEHVTFASATNGGSCSGSNISWNLTVPAETRISVSYTVKVKDSVSTAYTKIDGHKATINGVSHKCPHTYVANTLTAAQQQQLVAAVNTVKAQGVSGLNGVQIANLIYKTAFGIDNLFGDQVTNGSLLVNGNPSGTVATATNNIGVFNDSSYWSSSNKTSVAFKDTNTSLASKMVAPGMFGGGLVYTTSKDTYTRYTNEVGEALRSRYFWEKDLIIGDIFLMRGSSSTQMHIYIGNDTFVSIGEGFTVFTEKSVSERFQYAPDTVTWKYLAVIRPSMAHESI